MVNRIDENNYYNTYSKTKNVNIPNTGEKFSLNYNQEELQAQDSEKKDKTEKSEKELKQAGTQGGVRLELSNSGKTASADRLKASEAEKTQDASGQSVLEMIREIVTAAVAAVKDFFYKLWNDPDVKQETGSDAVSEMTADAETKSENGLVIEDETKKESDDSMQIPDSIDSAESLKIAEQRLDREIQPYLRKGDLNQVISLLTDNGKKTVAMNSTLLTYYDRNGKMVEINASDRERILRGDRNVRKL